MLSFKGCLRGLLRVLLGKCGPHRFDISLCALDIVEYHRENEQQLEIVHTLLAGMKATKVSEEDGVLEEEVDPTFPFTKKVVPALRENNLCIKPIPTKGKGGKQRKS